MPALQNQKIANIFPRTIANGSKSVYLDQVPLQRPHMRLKSPVIGSLKLVKANNKDIFFAEIRLRVYLPKLVNETPVLLLEKIATHSIQGFSSNIKRFYLHAYESECSIPHCYVCRSR